MSNLGFHSLGSRSALALYGPLGIAIAADVIPVGLRGRRMGLGEDGAEIGGVFVEVIATAAKDSGLQESLRRQASLQ